MNPFVTAVRESAVKALESGDPAAAMEALLDALQWPSTLETNDFNALIETMGKVGSKFRKLPFATELKEAARKPDDGKLLFVLGQALLEEGLFGPAATVLARAHDKRRSHEETLAELVHALESLGHNADALRYLQNGDESLLKQSFILQYLLAFNALMCCQVDLARQILPELLEETEPELAELAGTLQEMAQRVDAMKGHTPLDAQDLQGWHLVTTGGVLLTGTRQGALKDSIGLVQIGIGLLKEVLRAAGLTPPLVIAPDEARSVALGRAVASSLGVPFKVLPPTGSVEAALHVVYDLQLLDEKLVDLLQWHRHGQPLFAHLAPWGEEPPFVADFTTALYGTLTPLDGAMEGAASPPSEKAVQALRALVQAAAQLKGTAAPGWLQYQGQRRRQRTDSPVPR